MVDPSPSATAAFSINSSQRSKLTEYPGISGHLLHDVVRSGLSSPSWTTSSEADGRLEGLIVWSRRVLERPRVGDACREISPRGIFWVGEENTKAKEAVVGGGGGQGSSLRTLFSHEYLFFFREQEPVQKKPNQKYRVSSVQ